MNYEISPQIAARLNIAAQMRRIDPTQLLESLLADSLPPIPSGVQTTPIDAENAAAIAWLEQRMAEDATDDPEEIRKADEEVAELRRNLNANRAATGERLVSR
jgi:hypothetical protein